MSPANVETMAYARTGGVPWHKLGVALDGAIDSDRMLKASGLDWSVELAPLTATWNGRTIPLDDRRAVIRTDTGAVIGDVGDGYNPLQNRAQFDWLDGLLADGLLDYETAASLDGGRRTFALAHIPSGARTIAGDLHKSYLLITSGHDGNHAVTPRAVMTRVVCANTLDAALGEKGGALGVRAIRHSASMEEKLRQAQDTFRLVTAAQDRMAAWLEAAAVTTVKAEELDRLVDKLFGKADERGPRVQINLERFRGVLGAEVVRGGSTAYSVLQGVTGYADHERVREFSTRDGAERRFETSMVSGQGVTLKADAFAFLSELVTV